MVHYKELRHILTAEAREHLGFGHAKVWRDSVVTGRKSAAFISTQNGQITLHSDTGQSGGHVRRLPLKNLLRTILSGATNAAEHCTLVRQEMAAWTQLQLEPSALRKPDSFTAPTVLAPNGEHLPAALHALVMAAGKEEGENLLARIANDLSQLVETVRSLRVDLDDRRQSISVVLQDDMGTDHFASSLSDGTLRFLALIVLKNSTAGHQVLCLEEPENGIHPRRIRPMLSLLRDLVVDPEFPVNETNPFRQVILNTHSPLVVEELSYDPATRDSILFMESVGISEHGIHGRNVQFFGVEGTWRKKEREGGRERDR